MFLSQEGLCVRLGEEQCASLSAARPPACVFQPTPLSLNVLSASWQKLVRASRNVLRGDGLLRAHAAD